MLGEHVLAESAAVLQRRADDRGERHRQRPEKGREGEARELVEPLDEWVGPAEDEECIERDPEVEPLAECPSVQHPNSSNGKNSGDQLKFQIFRFPQRFCD